MAIKLKIQTNEAKLKVAESDKASFTVSEGVPIYPNPYTGPTEVTPTEEEQTLETEGLMMISDVTVAAIPSDYIGSDIPHRTGDDIIVSGASVTTPTGHYPSDTTKTVQSGSVAVPTGGITANPSISVDGSGLITASVTKSESVSPIVNEGYVTTGSAGTITFSGSATSQLSTQGESTITPTENEQTAVTSGKYTTGDVKVGAIPSQYIVPSGTKSISANGQGIDVTEYASVDVSVPSDEPNLQTKTKTYTPTTSQQTDTITADSGYDGLDEVDVTVNAMPSGSVTAPATITGTNASKSTSTNTLTLSTIIPVTPVVSTAGYVSSGTERNVDVSLSTTMPINSSSSLQVGGATVTAPAGYYASNASATVASGTEGTPTATKGSVVNHAMRVHPSVTNTAGYITGGTHDGQYIEVAASEVVSGSETKTANGTYDVTNLAQLIVNVSGGGGSGLVYETGEYKPTSNASRPTISFANSHSETPFFVAMFDSSAASGITSSSNVVFVFYDPYRLTGGGFPYSTSETRYAAIYYSYRSSSSFTSNSAQVSYNSDNTGDSSNAYSRYWVTASDFKPYSNSTSRYWRANRVYKWIAVWKPTT